MVFVSNYKKSASICMKATQIAFSLLGLEVLMDKWKQSMHASCYHASSDCPPHTHTPQHFSAGCALRATGK